MIYRHTALVQATFSINVVFLAITNVGQVKGGRAEIFQF
jgi:hypothetical protein